MGVGQAQEYPPPAPLTAPTFPPPPTVEEEQYYPPPPTVPAVDNYRTSMGVVNGEVGAVQTPQQPPQARRDPYAGMTVPMTPLTPALKTPTFKEEADVDKYDLKVRKYDQRDLAVKLRVRLAKIFLRGINCACRLVFRSILL